MKGGKGGRPRRTPGGGAKSGAPGRKDGKGLNVTRSSAPKKGEPRKPFGGRSSSGEQ